MKENLFQILQSIWKKNDGPMKWVELIHVQAVAVQIEGLTWKMKKMIRIWTRSEFNRKISKNKTRRKFSWYRSGH